MRLRRLTDLQLLVIPSAAAVGFALAYDYFGPIALAALAGPAVWLLVEGWRSFIPKLTAFSVGPLELSLEGLEDGVGRSPSTQVQQVQEVAASQIKLLTSYYNTVLGQARESFRVAVVGVGVGLVFFVAAIGFLLASQPLNVATVSAVAGGVVQLIAGLNFVLYGKTTAQLATFHQRLEQTQRFLLANSVAESLNGETQESTRARLVFEIAGASNQSDSWGDSEPTAPRTS
jgi:hypothetical protein